MKSHKEHGTTKQSRERWRYRGITKVKERRGLGRDKVIEKITNTTGTGIKFTKRDK